MVSQGDTKSKIVSIMYIVILVAVVAIGLFGAVTSYLDYNSEKAEVDGTVISSEVDEDSSRRGVSYTADITYEYSYNGQSYENDNIKPGAGSVSMSRTEAESLVSEYSEGDTVTVHVNENSPSTSWLVDELPIGSIFGSLAVTLGGLFILYKKRTQSASSNA